MKKYILSILSVILFSVSLQAANDLSLLPKLKDTWRETLGLPIGENRPCVIDFGATWCMPCQQFKPTYEKLAKRYAGKIDMVSCDYDKNKIICSNYRVQVLPTIILFDAEGKPWLRYDAAPMESEFVDALEELLSLSGVEDVFMDGDDGAGTEYYTLDGRMVLNPDKGIYIRKSKGETRLVRL